MHPSTRVAHRSLRWAALALSLVLLGAGVGPAHAAELPPGPTAPAPAPDPVDAYPSYQPQSTCDPTPKPGAQHLMSLVLTYYRVGRSTGITRACSVGGTSEHKEGRALDWGVSVDNPDEKAAADSFVQWLTAVGPDGKVGYNARRIGVMYVIWNGQIWNNTSSGAAWRAYTGASPHTDHVHVSLTWAGAYRRGSWWTGVALPAAATTRTYVSAVYRDLFSREPDPVGLSTWTDALTAGTPRVAVANAITASAEYRGGLIRASYVDFLAREPETEGGAFWLAAMNAGLTIQQMEAGFLASPEYFARAGGTDDAWVRQLYRHVLQREAADGEVLGWTGHLAAGNDRGSVAMGFLLSTERLTTVTSGYYLHLLGRDLDATGRQTWVAAIQAGTRTEAIIGGIVASEEYYVRAQR